MERALPRLLSALALVAVTAAALPPLGPMPAPVRWLAGLLAAAALPALFFELSAAAIRRCDALAKLCVGLAAVLPLAGNALWPGRAAGSAAAGGAQGLSLLGLVLLAAYLCLHLRGSLLRARYWGSSVVLALAGLAAARAQGTAVGPAELVVAALCVATGAAITTLSGALPATRPASEVPLGELAAMALLAAPASGWSITAALVVTGLLFALGWLVKRAPGIGVSAQLGFTGGAAFAILFVSLPAFQVGTAALVAVPWVHSLQVLVLVAAISVDATFSIPERILARANPVAGAAAAKV